MSEQEAAEALREMDRQRDTPDDTRRFALVATLEEAWKRALESRCVGIQSRERHVKLRLLETCGDYVRLYGADPETLTALRGQLAGVEQLLLSWSVRNR
jgi:hypothetical protein